MAGCRSGWRNNCQVVGRYSVAATNEEEDKQEEELLQSPQPSATINFIN